MNARMKLCSLGVITAWVLLISGCAAEIGSERWCAEMKSKQPADWTTNQAIDYAKHCILK
jgi:hypothetical protein